MTTLIKEVYDAFRAAGTPEEQAAAAAQAMAPNGEVATKTDIAELRGELTLLKWMVGVNTAGIALLIALMLVLLRTP